MKFLHLADLHLGKSLCGRDMLPDQRHILPQILSITKTVDLVVIAGDVFQTSQPSSATIALANEYFTEISKLKPLIVISGNHDNAELLGLTSIGTNKNLYVFYKPKPHKLELGGINFWAVPFTKPSDIDSSNYDEMFKEIFGEMLDMGFDRNAVNVLISHQTFGNCEFSESERTFTISEQINFNLDIFSYCALGHIHKPQNVSNTAIYPGSPLKYSKTEASDKKNFLIVDIDNDNNVVTKKIPVIPLYDMRVICKELSQITNEDKTDDYIYLICKNKDFISTSNIHKILPNLLSVDDISPAEGFEFVDVELEENNIVEEFIYATSENPSEYIKTLAKLKESL